MKVDWIEGIGHKVFCPELEGRQIKSIYSWYYDGKAILECTDGTLWSIYASGEPPTIFFKQLLLWPE